MYLVMFVTTALFAELRFIECFRNLTFRCLKHVYFVSSYSGRGVFYIFIGTLLFDQAIGYILGISMILIGLVNIIASNTCPSRLPVYTDQWALDDTQLGNEHIAPPPPPPKAPSTTPAGSYSSSFNAADAGPVPSFLPAADPVNPFAVPQPLVNQMPSYSPAAGRPPPPAAPAAASSTGTALVALGTAATGALGNLQSGVSWLKDHRDHLTPENLEFAATVARFAQGPK